MPRPNGDQRAQQRKQYLARLIDRIDESLGLTDKQRRRLVVASKGAVEYLMAEARQQPGRWRNLGARLLNGQEAAVAANHPIWRKTLEKMFSDAERRKITRLEQEQLANMGPV